MWDLSADPPTKNTATKALLPMPSPDRPLVSFVLLAYNQEEVIREAVEGAFSQTYSPLEIILSDDCSKDRTFEIIQEMAATYHGPHKIVLNRNPKNLGIGQHYSRIMELASGEIVELAAGDDISLPWRTTDSVSVFQQNPELTCVAMALQHFTDSANKHQVLRAEIKISAIYRLGDFVKKSDVFFVNAPGRAFRKFTHDCYGPLIAECPVEDGSNLFRCLLHGAVARCDNIGVLYRWNGQNVSCPANFSKIPLSGIYSDYLASATMAFRLGHIDDTTHQKLTTVFHTLRENSLLLEELRIDGFAFHPIMRMLSSPHYSSNQKIKLLGKLMLRSLGVNRWKF